MTDRIEADPAETTRKTGRHATVREETVALARGNKTFLAVLGAPSGSGGTSFVREARGEGPEAPASFVVKIAKKDYGHVLAREASVLEELVHPGLIQLLGRGQLEDGTTAIAFERLAPNPLLHLSGPLRPRFRDPGTTYFPLPPGRALEVAFDVLLAIEHVHSRGWVHGDVKLSNVMLRTNGEDPLRELALGNAEGVLIDFGSSRRATRTSCGLAAAELSDLPGLTPLYCPPEALLETSAHRGERVLSQAMDIYAFGLVAYALLTGCLPYGKLVSSWPPSREEILDVKNRESRGELRVIDLAALDEIPLHDVAWNGDAQAFWPQFHAAARHLLSKCVDKDPTKRWTASSAREFFANEFRMRPSLASAGRAWTQETFQMRPLSNRLVGDAPLGGIRIREERGAFVVVEAKPERPRSRKADSPLVEKSSASFDAEDALGRTTVGEKHRADSQRLSSMDTLGSLRRSFSPGGTLPIAAPVLLIQAIGAPIDPFRTRVVPLHLEAHRMRIVGETAMDEEAPKRLTVGRAPDCDLSLRDSAVSKVHVVFFLKDGAWMVEDAGSRNGTMVDGKLLGKGESAPLSGRMEVLVGPNTKLTFLDEVELRRLLAPPVPAIPRATDLLSALERRVGRDIDPTPRDGGGQRCCAS